MAQIHPTACVDVGAYLGAQVEIGPLCVVGPHVRLEDGVRLISHVSLAGHTHIGGETVIYPFAALGHPPQSVRYRGGPTRLEIGARCIIREHVTINTGTEDGGGLTKIGDDCMLMAASHVAHDCHVGNHVIFANNATLGGHVSVGDHVFIGGLSAVHQFVRIGEQAIIGGMTGVEGDVIPFSSVIGERGALGGLNVVGLKRRGFSRVDIHELRRAYRQLFFAGGSWQDRRAAVAAEFSDHPAISKILDFIDVDAKRRLLAPRELEE